MTRREAIQHRGDVYNPLTIKTVTHLGVWGREAETTCLHPWQLESQTEYQGRRKRNHKGNWELLSKGLGQFRDTTKTGNAIHLGKGGNAQRESVSIEVILSKR